MNIVDAAWYLEDVIKTIIDFVRVIFSSCYSSYSPIRTQKQETECSKSFDLALLHDQMVEPFEAHEYVRLLKAQHASGVRFI